MFCEARKILRVSLYIQQRDRNGPNYWFDLYAGYRFGSLNKRSERRICRTNQLTELASDGGGESNQTMKKAGKRSDYLGRNLLENLDFPELFVKNRGLSDA